MGENAPGEGSFGEELKRQRLLREVSLESIAAATKISVRHLEALERGDFARLPAPVFTRGFIRAYASILGVDPDEMVNAYLADTGSGGPRIQDASDTDRTWRRPSTRVVVLGIVGAAFAVLIAAAVWRSARRPRADAAAAPSLPPVALSPHIHQVPAPAGSPAPTSTAASPAGTVSPGPAATGPPPAPRSDPAEPPPSSADRAAAAPAVVAPLTLALSSDAECWSQIVADGRPVFSGIFRPGETRRFDAREGFRVTAGNAGALRLAVNGRSLPALGRAGEVVRDVRIDADSVNALLSRPE